MLESKSLPIKFGCDLFEGRTHTAGVGAHNQLVFIICRTRFGLQGDDAIKSKLRYYGDL